MEGQAETTFYVVAVIAVVVAVVYLLLGRNPPPALTAKVIAGGPRSKTARPSPPHWKPYFGISGNVAVEITPDDVKPEDLINLALCYAAKVRWLTLTAPHSAKQVFETVYRNTIKAWPEIPYVEMIASLKQEQTVYSITLYCDEKIGPFIQNKLPRELTNDLATQFFFLLADIVGRLEPEFVEKMGISLERLQPHLFASEDKSLKGLRVLSHKAVEALL